MGHTTENTDCLFTMRVHMKRYVRTYGGNRSGIYFRKQFLFNLARNNVLIVKSVTSSVVDFDSLQYFSTLFIEETSKFEVNGILFWTQGGNRSTQYNKNQALMKCNLS